MGLFARALLTVFSLATTLSASAQTDTPVKYLLSSRFITSDEPQKVPTFIHLACEASSAPAPEDPQNVRTILDCPEVGFVQKIGEKITPVGNSTYLWENFRSQLIVEKTPEPVPGEEPAATPTPTPTSSPRFTIAVAPDLGPVRSNKRFVENDAFSKRVSWKKGEKLFPSSKKWVQKIVSVTTGTVQWTFFHAYDAIAYTLTKPKYLNEAAETKSNYKAFEYLTEKPTAESLKLREGFFTYDSGFKDLLKAIENLPPAPTLTP